MPQKSYAKGSKVCRVTFRLPAEIDAKSASLCGEFNGWDPSANPMKRLKDGSFKTSLSLPSGRSYRFRYLIDGERWENDWNADGYIPNSFGSDDSVVEV